MFGPKKLEMPSGRSSNNGREMPASYKLSCGGELTGWFYRTVCEVKLLLWGISSI